MPSPFFTTTRFAPATRAVRVLMACVLLAPFVQAQDFPETKWTKSDPIADDQFGNAVDLDGAVAVVGARNDNDSLFKVGSYGAAYVFRFDGSRWIEEAKLTAPQRDFYDYFGEAVAVGGDVVLVGTRNDEDVDSNAGAVYVYRYDGSAWTQEAKLIASDGRQGDFFGSALAVEGGVALVGARTHSGTDHGGGAVYVYRYDGSRWVEEAELTPSEPAPGAHFGQSVALSGTRALIGAWAESLPAAGQSVGAAYVFEYDGSQWVETARLAASDASAQAQFGLSVALDGDRALIGAPLDDELSGGAGAAYVFRYDGSQWTEEAKLLAPDHTGFNLFGSAVALSGPQALVGAENWFPEGEDATGKAYLFQYDAATETWQEQAGLVPGDAGRGDNVGSAVALDDGVLLVGAPSHNRPIPGVGAVYSYGEPIASPVEHSERPGAPRVSAAYPNPFRQQAHLTLTLPVAQPVRVTLFDVLGRQVRVLHDGLWPAQTARPITIPAGDLPNGVYLVRVATPTFAETRPVTLLR